jgi:hypothetical protein
MSKKIIGIVGIKNYDDEATFLSKVTKKLKRFAEDDTFEFITSEENGIAALVRKYCTEHNEKYLVVKADWDEQGNRAGYNRNETIVDMAKELFVFWDGQCPYLKEIIDNAMRFKKRVSIIFVTATEDKARYDIDVKHIKIPNIK